MVDASRFVRVTVVVALAAWMLRPVVAGAQGAPGPESFFGGGMAGTQTPSGAGAAAGGLTTPPTRGVDVIRSTERPEPPRPEAASARPAEQPAPAQAVEAPKSMPNDFQLFAATSVGSILPIFGQDLFTRPPSTFAPVDDVPPSSEYVIGTGDEIVIRGWGQVDIDVRANVSREGTINIPRVGVVSVVGVRYQDLPAHIRRSVARYYRNFELSVSLGRLRSIQVFVIGQTLKPGLYTVSSFSTLMNALFASGGPSPTGSMRRIQLRRADKLVGELDLYDLLLKGDKSKDERLQSGDVIFIPPVGPVAAVAGRVKTAAIFELKGDGTSLADLVSYAGGLTTTAATQSLLIEHLDRNAGRLVQEVAWDDSSQAVRIRDGDVVTFRAISQKFDNAVTLRGHVAFPIRTAWRQGLTVADLIPDRSVLIPEAYWARAASRAFESSTAGYGKSLPKSERQNPQVQERIKTDVENLLDEVNWDYAVVERLDRTNLEPRLIPFNLRRAIVDKDPAQNLELAPGDIVTVFSKKDIASPAEKRTYFVRAEGELAVPGIYQVKPGETLRQLIARAGGLTRDAYPFGAEFTRESVRADQQGRLDEIANRADQDLQRVGSERLARANTADEAAATRAQIEAQRTSITRIRSFRASGRMVLELRPEASVPSDFPDLPLEDGDRLYVPRRYSSVGVFGAVYNQSTFIYKPGKNIDDYLKQAGGPSRQADTGSTYVLRADGSVMSRRQAGMFSGFGGRTLMPNDNVVVPEEFEPSTWVKDLKDWSQIFFQFGLGIAAISVLK
jgi:polysaccharide export outer membrane protein